MLGLGLDYGLRFSSDSHDQPPCMSLLTTEGLKTLFNGFFFAGLIIESGVYKMIEFISITNVNLIKM